MKGSNAEGSELRFVFAGMDPVTNVIHKAMSLGARLLKPAGDPQAVEGFQVYTDPAVHPFCLGWR